MGCRGKRRLDQHHGRLRFLTEVVERDPIARHGIANGAQKPTTELVDVEQAQDFADEVE
jgi:hypothetical protein